MNQVLEDLLQRLLVQAGWTLEELIWGTLGFCLLFSTTHLVSMLITRWGDHRATGKSLLFSVAVHVACFMGACGMHLQSRASLDVGEQTAVPVRKLIVDDETQPPVNSDGNVPIWDRLPPLETEMSRAERKPLDLTLPDAPDRQMVPQDRAEPELPGLTIEPMATAPTPEKSPVEMAAAARPTAPLPDESGPEPESRPEASELPTPQIRQPQVREGGQEMRVSRKPDAGATDRISETLDLDRNLASLPARTDTASPLPKAPGDELMRRTGPVPSSSDLELPGASEQPEASAASSGEPTRSDIRRRLSTNRNPLGDEPLRPERGSEAGAPAPGRELASTDPLMLNSPRRSPAPGLDRPESSSLNLRGNTGVPATYQLRSLARRRETARKYGGTEASEKAVESALRWFASVQQPDGSWDGDRFGAGQVKIDEKGVDREYAGREADTGLTALVILCYLGAGYTHEEGPYAPQVDKAIRWLVAQQRDDGYLGGNATRYAQMYCHGIATYALAEAYGMQSDPASDTGLREPLQRAVQYILEMQNPSDGGWRYVRGQKSDMSMFGWQLMALKSSEIAGLRIPNEARDRMIQFLKDRSRGEQRGLAGYREESPPSAAMTAESMFCKQMLGISRSNPQSREAVQYLLARLPRRADYDEYYWYYGTLAMYQYGGPEWERWNETMRDLLISEQLTRGEFTGSWEPRGAWGRYGGRIYQTALSTLCLEVYYRFLPLYRMNGPGESTEAP